MQNVTFLIYFGGFESCMKTLLCFSVRIISREMSFFPDWPEVGSFDLSDPDSDIPYSQENCAVQSAQLTKTCNEHFRCTGHVYSQSLLYIVIGDCCVVILSMYNVCFRSSDFLVDKYKEQLRNHSQAVSCNFCLLRSKFAHYMFIFTCFLDSDVKKRKIIQSNTHKYNKQPIPQHSVNHFSRCYLGASNIQYVELSFSINWELSYQSHMKDLDIKNLYFAWFKKRHFSTF